MADVTPRIRVFQSENTEPGHAVIHLGGVERAPLDESFSIHRADDEIMSPGSNWPAGLRKPISSEWYEGRHLLELSVGPDVINPIQGGTPVRLHFPGLGREETLIWPDDLLLQPEGARLWRRPDRKALRAAVVTPVQTRAEPVRRADAPKADDTLRQQQVTQEGTARQAAELKQREADALAFKEAEEAKRRAEEEQRQAALEKFDQEERARKDEAERLRQEDVQKQEAAKADVLHKEAEARKAEDEKRLAEEKRKKIEDEKAKAKKPSAGLVLAAALAGLVIGAGAVEAWHQFAAPKPVGSAAQTDTQHIAEVLCLKPGKDRGRALERLLAVEPASPLGIPSAGLTPEMMERLAKGTYEGSGGQAQNYDEALYWTRQLARQGRFVPALGTLYHAGTPHQPADQELAELSWQLAAAAGSGGAMALLGKFYEDGACGTDSRKNAEFWYRMAARDSDPAIRQPALDGLNRITLAAGAAP